MKPPPTPAKEHQRIAKVNVKVNVAALAHKMRTAEDPVKAHLVALAEVIAVGINLEPQQQAIADKISQCYSLLAKHNSNIVRELLKEHEDFYQWEHYPKNDYFDKETFCQYYYHSHPSKDQDRLKEHGHFHVFIREDGIPEKFKPIYTSEKYIKNKTDNLCHLFGINMDKFGMPIGLFTVNHWVTLGLWYDAEVIGYLLDFFHVNEKQNKFVNIWLNSMVKLFKPAILELNQTRDTIIQAWKKKHPNQNVFADRNLEVTSFLSLR